MFIKPNDGLKVKDPVSFIDLPPEGKEVEFNLYWQRMINDGAVTVCDNPDKTEEDHNA